MSSRLVKRQLTALQAAAVEKPTETPKTKSKQKRLRKEVKRKAKSLGKQRQEGRGLGKQPRLQKDDKSAKEARVAHNVALLINQMRGKGGDTAQAALQRLQTKQNPIKKPVESESSSDED